MEENPILKKLFFCEKNITFVCNDHGGLISLPFSLFLSLNNRREEEGGEKLSSKSDRISSTMETFRNFLSMNLSIFLFAYILDGGEKIGQTISIRAILSDEKVKIPHPFLTNIYYSV